MFKVYRINAKTKAISEQEFDKSIAHFGNRGLTSKIVLDEVNPKCDPLGAENKLVVATSVFAGTPLTTAGRVSFGAKSPLTGGIKEANVGGSLGSAMARHGIKMFIIEDLPADDKWYYVKVSLDGTVQLIPADDYVGLNTYDFVSKMEEIYGKNVSIAAIGAAGERQYKVASVMVTEYGNNKPCRAAGRGGLGAVMGSKKIKAIVIEKAQKKYEVEYADKELFNKGLKNFVDSWLADPNSLIMQPGGTHLAVEYTSPMNVMPVKNFSGEMVDQERFKQFNFETFLSKIKNNGGKTSVPCQPGCMLKCSTQWANNKGEYVTAGLEYETTVLFGPNCDIYNLDFLAECDRFCDNLGMDTMDVACSMAVCMDAGKIPWGDEQAVKGLLEEMAKGTEFGKILGQGTLAVGKYLGAKRIPHVKGQAIPAYDPRGLKGQGISYTLSAMGADHTTGNTLLNDQTGTNEEKVKMTAGKQIASALADNIGCLFVIEHLNNPDMADLMFSGLLGDKWSVEKVSNIGIETLRMEKEFNRAAGFTIEDDKLPEFFYTEKNATGSVFDITPDEVNKAFNF